MAKEKVFPCAHKTHYYSIEGKEGYYRKITYAEAKNDRMAFRAALNNKTIHWFAEIEKTTKATEQVFSEE